MGRGRWTTPDQRKWLEERIPAFVKAQDDKTTSTVFFPETHEAWRTAWPIELPSEKEINDAGDTAKALAIKTKATEDRVFYWFHNNTRTSSSGTGKRGLLKIKPKTRLPKEWQAYQTLYYQTKLKPMVDAAYEAYLATVPEGTTPAKKRFAIMNEVVQKAFAEETEEVKNEVTEYRRKLKEEPVEDLHQDKEARNSNYQSAINRFPQTLTAMGNSFIEQTGWNLTCIAGGPNPRMGGKITTFAIHFGKTAAGVELDRFMGSSDWDAKVMENFDNFLHECFSQEICDDRALVKTSMQSTPDLDAQDEGPCETPEDSHSESEPPKQPTTPKQSEYEIARAANIARNKELADKLDRELEEKYGNVLPELNKAPPKPARKKREKKKKNENPTRRSSRNNEQQSSSNPPASTSSKHAQDENALSHSRGNLENDKTTPNPPASHAVVPLVLSCPRAPVATVDAESTTPVSPQGPATNTIEICASTPSVNPIPSQTQTPEIAGSDMATVSVPTTTTDTATSTMPTTSKSSASDPASDPHCLNGETPNLMNEDEPSVPINTKTTGNGDSAGVGPEPDVGLGCLNNKSDDVTNHNKSIFADSDEVTGNGGSTELVIDVSPLPRWLKDAVAYFQVVSAEQGWQDLISSWLTFEQRCHTEGKLPTKYRPEEVAWWMQRRRRYDLVPEVKPAEFSAEWYQWWRFIQPEWREDDTRVVPHAADWTALEHGGPNGLFLIVMALSWWERANKIQSKPDKESDRFMLAVSEVQWVITEVLKTLPVQAAGKHTLADDPEDQPAAKRHHS